jgi:arylsulfatase A-like enzyme
MLLADDLGYGELGCYGQDSIKTPVLDKLAKEGLRFTNFYAGNSVCSPSRAVLMTGKQSTYNTIRGNNGYFPSEDKWLRVALTNTDTTLAEIFKKGGYQTAFFGKWHLDDPNDLDTWAHARGFDYAVQEQWAMRNGGRQFSKNMEYINGLQDSVFYEVDKWQSKDEFRTELAIQHLDKMDKRKPFFLFMSYRAPHAHERVIGNKTLYANRGWKEKERMHAAKITLLDQQIGRLLDKLRDMGELDNTLVIFTSDNGPHRALGHDPEFFNSNGPLRGYKRDMYEGGIRIPMIAYWKGKIQAGTVSEHVGSFQDFMPTFVEITNPKKTNQDNGISLLPIFEGKVPVSPNNLIWEFQLDGHWANMANGGFRQAIRIGKWKGVRYGVQTEMQLFDLDTDVGETNNVASEHPDIVRRMNEIFISERTDNVYFPYGGITFNKVE